MVSRLIGFPIAFVGLTLLVLNGPYSRMYFRLQERWRLPFAYRSLGTVRTMTAVIGAGWTLIGVSLLTSVIRPS